VILVGFFRLGNFNKLHLIRARYFRRVFRLVVVIDVAAKVDIAVNYYVSRVMESAFFVVVEFRNVKLIAIGVIAWGRSRLVLFELLWAIGLLPLTGSNAALCGIVIAHALK